MASSWGGQRKKLKILPSRGYMGPVRLRRQQQQCRLLFRSVVQPISWHKFGSKAFRWWKMGLYWLVLMFTLSKLKQIKKELWGNQRTNSHLPFKYESDGTRWDTVAWPPLVGRRWNCFLSYLMALNFEKGLCTNLIRKFRYSAAVVMRCWNCTFCACVTTLLRVFASRTWDGTSCLFHCLLWTTVTALSRMRGALSEIGLHLFW